VVAALLKQDGLIHELEAANSDLRSLYDDSVMVLAMTAEIYDPFTGEHLLGIRRLTELLAEELGLDSARCIRLGQASVLHDLGKLRIPRELLTRPGPLTLQEHAVVREHTIFGHAILTGRKGFELAACVARWHHEHWDGHGYPDGLREHEIPLEVAIVSVADAFDAIVRRRSYKGCIPAERAVAEILIGAGTQFHPAVARALVRLERRGLLEADKGGGGIVVRSAA
jgi:putative two-component system response regulator